MQRYGFKPSDDGKFSKFQEWDEGDLCLHTEALAEIYSIKNGFDATLAEKDATIASRREEVEGLRKEKYELMSLDTEQDDWLDAVEENDDLKDQIEKLNARIKELEDIMKLHEKCSLDDGQTIQDLQSRIEEFKKAAFMVVSGGYEARIKELETG